MRDLKFNSARHDYLNRLCREFIREHAPAIWEGLMNTVNLKYPSRPVGWPKGARRKGCRGKLIVLKGVESGADRK